MAAGLGRVYCILSNTGPVGHTHFHALSNLLNNLSGDRQLQVYRRSRFLLSRVHGVRLSRIAASTASFAIWVWLSRGGQSLPLLARQIGDLLHNVFCL